MKRSSSSCEYRHHLFPSSYLCTSWAARVAFTTHTPLDFSEPGQPFRGLETWGSPYRQVLLLAPAAFAGCEANIGDDRRRLHLVWRSSTPLGFRIATSSSLQPTSFNHIPLKPRAKARIKSVACANTSFRNGFLQPLSFHTYVWSTCEERFKIRFWSSREKPNFTGLQRRQLLSFSYQRASSHDLLLGCGRCEDMRWHFPSNFSVTQSLVAISLAKWSPRSPTPLLPHLLVLFRTMRSQVLELGCKNSWTPSGFTTSWQA